MLSELLFPFSYLMLNLLIRRGCRCCFIQMDSAEDLIDVQQNLDGRADLADAENEIRLDG